MVLRSSTSDWTSEDNDQVLSGEGVSFGLRVAAHKIRRRPKETACTRRTRTSPPPTRTSFFIPILIWSLVFIWINTFTFEFIFSPHLAHSLIQLSWVYIKHYFQKRDLLAFINKQIHKQQQNTNIQIHTQLTSSHFRKQVREKQFFPVSSFLSSDLKCGALKLIRSCFYPGVQRSLIKRIIGMGKK